MNELEKLRLRDGDIVVVKSEETMRELWNMIQETADTYDGPEVTFVFAPEGLERISRKEAIAILTQIATDGNSAIVLGNPVK